MDANGDDDLYNPFEELIFDSSHFDYEHCFLCGRELENQDSREHVLPEWLLRRFDLWNHQVALLNNTSMPYRQLYIPCCIECNNESLSQIENLVCQAVSLGFEAFVELDELTVFQWAAKIRYGLIFKELSLLHDRSNPLAGRIASPELLEEYRQLHYFLQSVRLPFYFHEPVPWSLFLVKTHSYEGEQGFDFLDFLMTMTFFIRMGDIGLLICFEDNSTQRELFSEFFDQFEDIALHPLQFAELSTIVYYQETLKNRTPKYVTMYGGDRYEVLSLPLQGFTSAPIYDEWDNDTYAMILHWVLRRYLGEGLELEEIRPDSEHLFTYLRNSNGEPNILDSDGNRIQPSEES